MLLLLVPGVEMGASDVDVAAIEGAGAMYRRRRRF